MPQFDEIMHILTKTDLSSFENEGVFLSLDSISFNDFVKSRTKSVSSLRNGVSFFSMSPILPFVSLKIEIIVDQHKWGLSYYVACSMVTFRLVEQPLPESVISRPLG